MPRVAFLLEPLDGDVRLPRVGPVIAEVAERLRGRGGHIGELVPEAQVWELDELVLRPEYDLYVLASASPLALSLGGALSEAGAAVVNNPASCSLARDKIAATATLAAAGLPVPPSWATHVSGRLAPLLEREPLRIRSHRACWGVGVRGLPRDEPPGVASPTSDAWGMPLPLLAQREAAGARELRVSVVGDRAWPTELPAGCHGRECSTGAPTGLPPHIERMALRCGAALGLELYGVRIAAPEHGSDAACIVDVEAFPGDVGASELSAHLADVLYERAARA